MKTISSGTRVALLVVAVAALAVAARFGFEQIRERVRAGQAGEAVAVEGEGGAGTTAARLAAEDDPARRRVIAAGSFMGVYLLTTRERPAYCRERGVDLEPFLAVYREDNAAVLEAARAALAAASVSEDQLRERLEPRLDALVIADMEEVARAHGVTTAEACRAIADEPEAIAAQLHASRLQPAVYRVLME